MSGLEFIVSYDPIQAAAQPDGRFAHEPSNIWVIRKQNRRKRNGMDDEVTVMSTYFVVGDCIYMAPSVASVVGNRIVRPSPPSNLDIRPQQHANTQFLLIVIRRHFSDPPHENRFDLTQFHPITWTHISTTNSPYHRTRPTSLSTEQREHAHAGTRLPNAIQHRSTIYQIRTGYIKYQFQLPRYPQSSRSIQSIHSLRGRIHGRESSTG